MFKAASDLDGVRDEFSILPQAMPDTAGNGPNVSVKKTDHEQQVVYGEVYAPGFPDSQGDFMSADSIREMAFDFMRHGRINKIDLHHTQIESGCYVVESFIAREDDPIFIPHSWVLGVKVPDPEIWELVKKGELNGFSFDGEGFRVEKTIEVELPDTISGRTDTEQDHDHSFVVRYSDDGKFLGGETGPAEDGHYHEILRGTVTEVTDGHAHRFSFVEGVLRVQDAN